MDNSENDQHRELIRLRERLAFREREFRELNHRVANSLQMASAFLNFHLKRIHDPVARDLMAETSTRLAAVGRLHRHLYVHDVEGCIELSAFLDELCPAIAESTGLGCVIEADPLIVRGETAQQIGIVINELALNAAKHAYREGQAGTVKIQSRHDGRCLRLTIADDGLGLGDDFNLEGQKGLGMSVVTAITRQLGGAFQAESPGGARFTLTLPIQAP